MYDKTSQSFLIQKNDSKNLDIIQVNKAKYWFQKNIDIYNNGFVSWNDIEFQLSYYTQYTDNLELFKKFYKALYDIWKFILKVDDNVTSQRLCFDRFLDAWGSLYNYVKKFNEIPDVFEELFKSLYDVYAESDEFFNLKTNLLFNSQYLFEGVDMANYNGIINIIKRFILSTSMNDYSYNLVPGLESYLNTNTNEDFKSNQMNNSNYNDVPVNDYKTNFVPEVEVKVNSGSQSPVSISNNLTKSYDHLSLFSSYSSDESLNNLVKKDLDVKVESFDVEKSKSAEFGKENEKKDKSVTQFQYYVDENMSEDDLIKHILSLQGSASSVDLNELNQDDKKNRNVQFSLENITYSVIESNENSNKENSSEKPVEYVSNSPTVSRSRKSNFYGEFKNNIQDETIASSVSTPTKQNIRKSRGYHGEFKKSRESLSRSTSGIKNRSFSRTDIRQEFKQSKLRSDSNNNNKNSRSFSRTDISQEFKRNRNRNFIIENKSDNIVENEDKPKSNPAKNIHKEFKRSKSRVNALKFHSNNSDSIENDLDESKTTLNSSESINQVDIKNYAQEFKNASSDKLIISQKSPINFPRFEDSTSQTLSRLNKTKQLNTQRYGFDGHTYSTQSLPQIEKNIQSSDNLYVQPTLSLNETADNKSFNEKLLARKSINQNKPINNEKSKINLELLDDNELESLKELLELRNTIKNEIENQEDEIPDESENIDENSLNKNKFLLSSVLNEMKQESLKYKKPSSQQIRRDAAWKKLKLCLETEAIYEIIENITQYSPNESLNEEPIQSEMLLVHKLKEQLKPVIRQIVREEFQRCISDLSKTQLNLFS